MYAFKCGFQQETPVRSFGSILNGSKWIFFFFTDGNMSKKDPGSKLDKGIETKR